jgi:hypothetical protein
VLVDCYASSRDNVKFVLETQLNLNPPYEEPFPRYTSLMSAMTTFESVYHNAHPSGLLPGLALLAADREGIHRRASEKWAYVLITA